MPGEPFGCFQLSSREHWYHNAGLVGKALEELLKGKRIRAD